MFRVQLIVSQVVPSNNLLENMEHDTRSLLRGLLCRNPTTRLGAHGGAMQVRLHQASRWEILMESQVRAHPFFAEIDWPLLEEKKVTPPYTPLSPADYLQKVPTQ